MSLFIVLLVCVCLGLWIGSGVISLVRSIDRRNPKRNRYIGNYDSARHHAISHRGFKTRAGIR